MAVRGEIHIQLNVDFADDPRVRALARYGRDARRIRDLYVQMLCYAKRTLSDGHVPAEQLGILIYPDPAALGTKDVARLVEVGLVEVVDEAHGGGWHIPGFLKRNKSRSQVQADAADKADRTTRAATIGNHRRWHERRLQLDPEHCVHCREAIARRDRWTIAASDPEGYRSDRTETETQTQTETETGLDSSSKNPPPPNPPRPDPIVAGHPTPPGNQHGTDPGQPPADPPATEPAAAPPRPTPSTPGPHAETTSAGDRRDRLVAEVRGIRPEWQPHSIHRVLADPKLTSVPWQRVEQALLAVAADPSSQGPGRVVHEGPWWAQQPAPTKSAPASCGQCSPARRVEDADGRDLGPCPNCHPSARR